MRSAFLALMALMTLSFAGAPTRAQAQDTEERFHDLFITAGYATAFGAALGTAILGLAPNPAENLHYIYAGASLGFIGGSILGSYVVFSPIFTDNYNILDRGEKLASSRHSKDSAGQQTRIVIRPLFDPHTKIFRGAGAVWSVDI